MQARGERINRDGDVVDIDVEAIEVEEVFEEGAVPQSEELAIEDSSTEVEEIAEPGVEDTAPIEDAETEDAAVAEDNPENPQE